MGDSYVQKSEKRRLPAKNKTFFRRVKNISGGRKPGIDVKPGSNQNPAVAPVVPSTATKQEYGSIVGVVEDIANFPSSQSSMMAVLSNEKLVEDFTKYGPQLYVRINLIKADTPSHYKWTASKGPNMIVTNGTLCTADIITKKSLLLVCLYRRSNDF
ncbi:hypothetical protein [Legionella tunisiensis]|uniref:hypothetical protein n=1 Tax=Legionella tunisiensis TaxID=1034944 RepID=UPI0004753BF8|nr:hypothetical protein [Legionella tunisiensis]